jgi:hypothetical protein
MTGKQFKCMIKGPLCWAALLLIQAGGCSWSPGPMLKPANDPAVSYRFPGFTLQPPEGENWFQSKNETQAVFYKTLSKPELFKLSAVVTELKTTVRAQPEEDFPAYVEGVLRSRLEDNTKLALLYLKVTPLTLNGAECAWYEAHQGERFFPPIREPRLEFIHQGYVCRHPLASRILIQGFYTERHLQDTDSRIDPKALGEADKLILSVQFTAP